MAAGTPTYNDMYILSQCAAFQNRIQAALLQACVNIASEGWGVPFHRERAQAVIDYLSSSARLTGVVSLFSSSCSTDAASIAAATIAATNYTPLTTVNITAQQALITDIQIFSAVSGQFNAYIREPT